MAGMEQENETRKVAFAWITYAIFRGASIVVALTSTNTCVRLGYLSVDCTADGLALPTYNTSVFYNASLGALVNKTTKLPQGPCDPGSALLPGTVISFGLATEAVSQLRSFWVRLDGFLNLCSIRLPFILSCMLPLFLRLFKGLLTTRTP